MKMKMTMLAAALALTVAGQANAAIVTGTTSTTGSSNLILSIWTATASFTQDLGINMSTFLAGVTGTNTALTASTASVGSTLFTTDAASFLAANAGAVWNVTAVDSLGTTGFSEIGAGKSLLTTTNANIKSAANSLATAQLNTGILTSITNANTYYTSANNAAGAATSVTAISSDAYYAGGAMLGANLSSKATFDTTAAIGSTMNFWYVTPSSTVASAKASVAQFGNTAGVSTWTLASNGNLTYVAPVAAVPEPGEWLLMLSGLALIGFVATRRKDEGSMTFA